jgi:hypothetical protein
LVLHSSSEIRPLKQSSYVRSSFGAKQQLLLLQAHRHGPNALREHRLDGRREHGPSYRERYMMHAV